MRHNSDLMEQTQNIQQLYKVKSNLYRNLFSEQEEYSFLEIKLRTKFQTSTKFYKLFH